MTTLGSIWAAGSEAAAAKGWSFTKLCMLTALYGGGANQFFYSNSEISSKIKEDSTYKAKIQSFKDEYNETGRDYFISSLAFNTGDLYMSIHNAKITARVQEDGNMKVTIDDEYDFTEMWDIVQAFKDSGWFKALGAAANNYGTFLQECGVLKPFHMYIYTYEWVGIKEGNTAGDSPIEKFVSVAESQIGYHEGSNNNTKYGAWYGLNYNPWCAMFVSWCAGQVGILDTVIPRYCYCPYGVNEYQLAGRYASRNSGYVPKRGDVIFYQEDGVSSHTGIVTGVNGNIVYTVEGNTSDMVARRSHYMSDTYILGYGISYGSGSFSSITMLSMGSKGESVRHLQNILISKGYSCGSSGADGDFGQGTYNAVCAFQRDYGLDPDGIVGQATWKALGVNSLSIWTSSVTGEPGIEKFINVAKEELKKGFKETNSNNITPYGEWYGMNGAAWCAMFVSWCADQAGILNTIVPRYAYCPTGVSLYKEKNRYKLNSSDYNPKAGDVIMFQTNGTIDHTGIVIDNSNNIITTIEGNASDTVAQRTYNKDSARIHGYGIN